MSDESAGLPGDLAKAFQLFVEVHITQMLTANELMRVMPHQLTLAQFGVLSHFSRHQNLSLSIVELARIFQVSKASMGETVDKLARKGFVKIIPNPKDRRGKIVSITPKGAAARKEAEKSIYPVIAQMMKAIGSAQFDVAYQALRPIRLWLDERRSADSD
ncbi:MAG: MarR family winged helix-turn-helix transcriptional regulator [Alphaproteobacteria bacterium]